MTPGLIETLALETDGRRQHEAAAAARQKAAHAASREQSERELRTEARETAMKATQQMTGVVIFPARWDVDDSDATVIRCTERIEGRVGVDVLINKGGFSPPVKAILVSDADSDSGECVTWKLPVRHDLPVARQPISPGRDWFRRALIELGVI